MHVTFWLNGTKEKALRLPRANLHLFQSLIYSLLPSGLANFLHEEGYEAGGKRLKLFAMSWPMAFTFPTFKGPEIHFPLPVRMTVSTPVEKIASGLAHNISGAKGLHLGKNELVCNRLELTNPRAQGERLTVQTLSPVTCYEGMTRRGRPYTLYFRPDEREFGPFIDANLKRKFSALFPDRPLPDGNVRVTALNVRERVALFKPDTSCPIKGWAGSFRLEGPEELLQVALNCGLGAKNSSGWGCVAPAASAREYGKGANEKCKD